MEPEKKRVINLDELTEMLTSAKESSSFVEEGLKRLIEINIHEMPRMLSELHASYTDRDFSRLQQTAHKMKSTIDILGIESIKYEIRKIESLAREREDSQLMADMVSFVSETCNTAMIELQEELDKLNSNSPGE